MRWSFPVLLMLLAQVISLVAPVSVIRCIGADGHERLELAGMGCFCLAEDADGETSECGLHSESDCCEHEHDGSSPSDDVSLVVADCSCQHSMADGIDQVVVRSVVEDSVLLAGSAHAAAPDWNDQSEGYVTTSGLRRCPLRPCGSLYLSVAAITVLRV